MSKNGNEKFNEFIESIKTDESFVLVGRGDVIAELCRMLEESCPTLNPYKVYKLTRTWIGDEDPTSWYKVSVTPLG